MHKKMGKNFKQIYCIYGVRIDKGKNIEYPESAVGPRIGKKIIYFKNKRI